MPFPEEILDIKVEAVVDSLWTDITDWVYKESITIERGSADESSYSQPTRCSFLLNNIDGRFSPRNPNSPYYGKIGKNTPLLVSVRGGDPFLDIPGAGVARSTGFATPADVDVRVDMQIWNWHDEPGMREVAGCYETDGWIMRIDNGRINVLWNGPGGVRTLTSPSDTRLNPPPSGRLTVRVVTDNAANEMRFYQGDSVDGPWRSLGVGGYTTDLIATTGSLYVGDNFVGGSETDYGNISGKVFRMQVRDGDSGPLVADADFTAQTVGATSFTDGTGNDWLLTLGAVINNQYNRFRGEVVAWPSRWTTGGFDSWVEMKAESIVRRYGQGVDRLRSPLTRTIPPRPGLVAYWPMEDPDGTGKTLSAATPDTRRLGVDGAVTLAAHAGPPGSDSLPSFGSDSSWNGEVNASRYPDDSSSWQVQWLVNFQQLTTTEQMFFRLQTTGTVREWRVFASQTILRTVLYQYDSGGALIELDNRANTWDFGGNVGSLGERVNHWQRWELSATQNGGNIDWHVAGADTDLTVGGVASYSLAGTVGPVNSVMGPPRGLHSDLDGLSVGHIAVYDGVQYSIFDRADSGFAGETGLERAQRLTDEVGENLVFLGEFDSPLTMGAQRPDRFLDLLRECATTDRGIFGDTRDVAQFSGFRFVGRSALYNQTPVLILDYEGDGEVHAPLDPTDDDQFARNRVTVEQERGGSAVAEKAEGVNSTEAPPFGIGPYETTVTVNTDGVSVLPQIAGWEVHLGTWDEERYPTVLLRLQAAPHLIPQALFIDQGTVIRIRNARDADTRTWVPPGDIDLMVRGYTETINQFQWEIELQCVPAKPYNVPVLTGTTAEPSPLAHDHVDTDGTQVVAAIDADDTVLPVYVYAGPTWTDDVVDTPFALTVGGEEVRVTAPGGIVNANPFFDTDLTGWSGGGIAASWSQEVVHPDPTAQGSALAVPDGVSASNSLISDITPAGTVKLGGTYVVSGWVFSPDGWSDFRVGVYWHNGPTFVSLATGPLTVIPAGTWTYLEATVTAPSSGVDSARVRIRQGNTPAATDIYYVWGVRFTRATSDWANDTFNRTVTDGWGEMDSGDDWVNSGGAAGDFDVTSGYGSHTLTTDDVARMSTISIPGPDFDLYVDVSTSVTATGDTIKGGLAARVTDDDNLYIMLFWFRTDGLLGIALAKRVGGVETPLMFIERELGYTAGSYFRLRFQGVGGRLKAKAWRQGDFESSDWHIDVQDTDLTTGDVGVYSITNPGNTNTNPVVRYDNFRVANPQALAVERSRNSVVKSHPVGDDVRLTNPAITAL